MSLRSKLKVPHYGLFYFEVDKTVSVVPLKKIRKVFKGDNTSKGSVVEIFYAGVLLKAEELRGKRCALFGSERKAYDNWSSFFSSSKKEGSYM